MRPEIYKNEGYQFMGAAFEVYNERGYGLAEEIYQECVEIELELRKISFHSKAELKCFYKGRELKKRYIPDLYVFGCLVVELKAVTEIAPEHEAQLHADRATTCGLFGELRPQGKPRMEAIHPVRAYPPKQCRCRVPSFRIGH